MKKRCPPFLFRIIIQVAAIDLERHPDYPDFAMQQHILLCNGIMLSLWLLGPYKFYSISQDVSSPPRNSRGTIPLIKLKVTLSR